MKRIAFILLLLIPALAWGFRPPMVWKRKAGRVFTGAGKELELQERVIGGIYNPNFINYRNASSRVWLKNNDTFRLLMEVNGIVIDEPLVTGTASCSPNKRQPIWIRVRMEKQANEPREPVEAIP